MNQFIVTESCYTMRKRARDILAGNWNKAVVLTLILFFVVAVPSSVFSLVLGDISGGAVGFVYSLIVTGPINYGYFYCLRRRSKDEAFEVSDIFSGFEMAPKLIIMTFVMGLLIFLWSLLFIIPGIIAAYRYSQAYILLVDNPKMGAMEAIRESKRMMKGNKGKLFALQLTFLGWAILASIPSFLTIFLPIQNDYILVIFSYFLSAGFLWLAAYATMSYIVFYINLISEGENEFKLSE